MVHIKLCTDNDERMYMMSSNGLARFEINWFRSSPFTLEGSTFSIHRILQWTKCHVRDYCNVW